MTREEVLAAVILWAACAGFAGGCAYFGVRCWRWISGVWSEIR